MYASVEYVAMSLWNNVEDSSQSRKRMHATSIKSWFVFNTTSWTNTHVKALAQMLL